MWRAYQRLIKRQPLLTNIATATVVMFTGDTLAQKIEIYRSEEPKQFDVCRNIVMVSWNSLFFSPFFLVWFRHLDGKFPSNLRGNMTKTVINAAVRCFYLVMLC